MPSFFQKVLISILLLSIVAALGLFAANVLNYIELDKQLLFDGEALLRELPAYQRVLSAAVLGLLGLVVCYAIYATWRGSSDFKKGYIVGDDPDKRTRIERQSVNRAAADFLKGFTGVVAAKVSSHNTRQGVRFHCKIRVLAATNIAQLAQEIQEDAKNWLESHTGIQVESLRSTIKLTKSEDDHGLNADL